MESRFVPSGPIYLTPRLRGPNVDPTNFSYTVPFGPKECRVPFMYGHFVYKFEAIKTFQIG